MCLPTALDAYAQCAESWAFTLMTIVASLLPNAEVAVAAIGVAYNVYGILFIAFVAFSMAACAQARAVCQSVAKW